MKLYRDAGWWEGRNEQDIEQMLRTTLSIGVWDGETLIGFARAVSDGHFRAYIEDVVVHRDYRKSGIGVKLVSKLLDDLSSIDVVSLFCEEQFIPFYEKNNFKHSHSQLVMHRKGTFT
ncbi:GNAT family N-acetyltransferase [Lederbergia sp. NSJ-179]|uniref:GNAT family N-acetyltransferase n=1 Tax=Lederbergia sp. NSJ-179 TaxID=2931402 RepID=UPI001FD5C012|nr:GNAT family N-acetyltransferase [Lederbergia sp. NSJ-179]MCJ7840471.1 GNAT family N-acetyltransferase [Lederbergia sp. NSJ-179]